MAGGADTRSNAHSDAIVAYERRGAFTFVGVEGQRNEVSLYEMFVLRRWANKRYGGFTAVQYHLFEDRHGLLTVA